MINYYAVPELANEKVFTRESTQEAPPPDSFEAEVSSWTAEPAGYNDEVVDDETNTSNASDVSDPDFVYYGLDSDYDLPEILDFYPTDSLEETSSEEDEGEEEEEEDEFVEKCVVFQQNYVKPVEPSKGLLRFLLKLVPSKRDAVFFLVGGVSSVYALVKAAQSASHPAEEV